VGPFNNNPKYDLYQITFILFVITKLAIFFSTQFCAVEGYSYNQLTGIAIITLQESDGNYMPDQSTVAFLCSYIWIYYVNVRNLFLKYLTVQF